MKITKSISWFYVCLFTVVMYPFLLGGLTDGDFLWQSYLGGKILTEGNFYAIKDTVWGTVGLGTYLDHEWLCNIMFYLCNSIGTYGVALAYSVCLAIVFIGLVSFLSYNKESLSPLKCFIILVYIFYFAIVLFKVKAYTVSSCFLFIEFILLDRYRKDRNDKVAIFGLFSLVLLWVNFHSAGIVIFFLVAVCYWFVYLRDLKAVYFGLGCGALTLVNPYGYKLLLFNLQHNGDDFMKLYNNDWRTIDAKEFWGMCFAIMLLLTIVLMATARERNYFNIILFSCLFLLCMQSARHMIYMFPLSMKVILDYDRFPNLKFKFFNVLAILQLILFCVFAFICFSRPVEEYKQRYNKDYMTEELASLLLRDGSDGLFSTDIWLVDLGLKNFRTGAYPYNPERAYDDTLLQKYGNADIIKDMEKKYGIDKFLLTGYVVKYSDDGVIKSVAYTLLNSDDYELLYEDDNFLYLKKVEQSQN